MYQAIGNSVDQKKTLEKIVSRFNRNLGGNGDSHRARLSDKAFDYVIECIRTRKYLPGTRITERNLAKELDMSHVPVREATQKLLEQGWVERIPRKGIYVKNFDNRDLQEIYQLREALETGAIRSIGSSLSREQINELKELTDLLESAYESENAQIYKEADTQFHKLIVHFSGNSRLENIFDSVVLQAGCFFFIGASGTAMYRQKVNEYLEPVSHVLIYEALANKDVIAAEDLVRKHINTGYKMISELRNMLNF